MLFVTQEMKDIVKQCCFMCHCPELYPMIRMSFNNRLKTSAGRAWKQRYNIYMMDFSPAIWKHAPHQENINTVIHETCHLIDFYKNGDSNHGPNWRMYMRACGVTPKRTHSILIPEVKKKRKVIVCQDCNGRCVMGPIVYKKFITKQQIRICPRCRKRLNPAECKVVAH